MTNLIRKQRFIVLALACALALLLFAGPRASSQTGGQYDLTWNTVDSGGTSTGGAYELRGAIGQADAGVHRVGAYALRGGFFSAGTGVYPCHWCCGKDEG
jgi:hypothetical protein